jgi:predicted HTH domain antitoxin
MVTMSKTLHIADDDALKLLDLSPEEFNKEARFLLAAKLYEQGIVSSGKAARFCGMGRVEFLLALPSVGVTISNMTADDLDQETPLA